MAKMTLKRGADIDRVREELRQKGIVVSQRMPDGSYSVFVNKRRWRYLIADPKEQERMAAASDRDKGLNYRQARIEAAFKHLISEKEVEPCLRWFYWEAQRRKKYDFLQKFPFG